MKSRFTPRPTLLRRPGNTSFRTRFQENPHKHGRGSLLCSCFWSVGHITIEDLNMGAAKIWWQVPECAMSGDGFKCTWSLRCLSRAHPRSIFGAHDSLGSELIIHTLWPTHAVGHTTSQAARNTLFRVKTPVCHESQHFKKRSILLLCMCAHVCVYVYVHRRMGALRGKKWVLDVLELGFYRQLWTTWYRYWKSNASSLQEQPVSFPTSPPLQPQWQRFYCAHTHDDFIVKNRVFVQLTSNSFYNYCIFIYSFCAHVCGVCVSLRTSMWVWLAEDNLQESVFFFDFVGPGIKLRSSRLAKIHWEIRFGLKFSSLYKNKHIHVTFNK